MYCGTACGSLVRSIVRGGLPHRATPRRKLYDRRSVYNFGNARALDPQETIELRERRRQGWRLKELARVYGVCTRTIERYLATPPPFRVEAEGWAAYFVIGQRDRPVQVSGWEPA